MKPGLCYSERYPAQIATRGRYKGKLYPAVLCGMSPDAEVHDMNCQCGAPSHHPFVEEPQTVEALAVSKS